MPSKDINFLISEFEEAYNEPDYIRIEGIRYSFLSVFPMESIKDMPVERYALGKEEKSFCWWLEFNTDEMGGIKGGSAFKHKIFYSKKDEKWIFPPKFKSLDEAWNQLRNELYNYLKGYETTGKVDLVPDSMISSMNMIRNKLLYLYFENQFLPMYNMDHLKVVYEFFSKDMAEVKDWDFVKLNKEVKKIKDSMEVFKDWNDLKFMAFVYHKIINTTKIYKIAPGDNASYWNDCYEKGYICIGWDEIGDLKNYADYNEFKFEFGKLYKDYDSSKVTQKSNEVWMFFSLNPGDIIVANKGISTILGVGLVSERGYLYDATRNEYKHIVYVNWNKAYVAKDITPQKYWAFRTVYSITDKLYKEIIEGQQGGNTDDNIIDKVGKKDIEQIEEFFTENDVKFFKQIEKNLIRKGNIILYGPPGTGKTYISNKFLKWKGRETERKINKEFCTFHPSYNYEDFMEGYRPHQNGNGEVVFKLTDGIFKELCSQADKSPEIDFYIIIDEINRGNVEKIFGEMITLIERDKRGMKLKLSQSKDLFSIPENLYIIGTMNTSDRSIKVFDAALRRRFAFVECMPDYDLINTPIDILELSPADVLKKINAKLREIEDREKQYE